MNKVEIAKLMYFLRMAAVNGDNLTEEKAEIYEELLADLDFTSARAAAKRLMMTTKFLPAPSEIREAVRDVEVGAAPDPMRAYGDLCLAVRRVGRYESPTFTDPIIASVVQDLNWESICDATNEEALRARFLEAYKLRSGMMHSELSLPEGLRLPPRDQGGLILPRAHQAAVAEIAGEPVKELAERLSARQLRSGDADELQPPIPVPRAQAVPAAFSVPRLREPETPEVLEQRRIQLLAELAAKDAEWKRQDALAAMMAEESAERTGT